jgi:ABC-type lipoprotein release transport system permease subunit
VNSSQQFDFLRSWKAYVAENPWVNNWGNSSPYTLIQLRPDADPGKVQAQIKDFVSQFRPQAGNAHTELALQPYPEKYLHSAFKNGQIDGGRIVYVHLFSLVAVFILLIACINFVNLSTASSAGRAKEVGVRKVVGAARSYLFGQFLSEAMLIIFVAVAIALVLLTALLPGFNMLTGKQLTVPAGQPVFWLFLTGLVLLTGLIAGSYPAFFLSSLNPVRVLSGKFTSGKTAAYLRKGLVIFQFSLSIILIIGMVVIYRQVQYVQNKDLGYDRENLVYLPLEGELIKKYDLFKDEAAKTPGVASVSRMKESPTVIGHTNGDIGWSGKDPALTTAFSDAAVGYDFVKTLKLHLKEGRDFSKEFADSASYLLNEAAVKKIGYQDPVGKPLWWGSKKGTIIGVLKDFHFNSMHTAIEPLVLRLADNPKWGTILVRVEAGKTRLVMTELEKIYKAINPDFTFSYTFSDQEYAKLYRNEQVISRLSNYFAALAVFISCLGLFGLAMFVAGQRTKEIGVRKVLGASVPGIVLKLSVNFLKPVALAMIVAFPVSWYLMNRWLEGFAYKVTISWRVFAVAGLLTLVIALLTVSYQSIKAALANPVKSLRSE